MTFLNTIIFKENVTQSLIGSVHLKKIDYEQKVFINYKKPFNIPKRRNILKIAFRADEIYLYICSN